MRGKQTQDKCMQTIDVFGIFFKESARNVKKGQWMTTETYESSEFDIQKTETENFKK